MLSALAAAAFCAASAAALALPLTAAAASGTDDVTSSVGASVGTPADESDRGCRGVEVSVHGEARVGSTLTATLRLTTVGAVTAALPDASGDDALAPEVDAVDDSPLGAAVQPVETGVAGIEAVAFEWLSGPASPVRPTPSPSPVPTATPKPTPVPSPTPTATPTAVPTAVPGPTPHPSQTPASTAAPAPEPTSRPVPDAALPTPTGADYSVRAADLGLVVRARAIVTRAGEEPVRCLSAPSAVVLVAEKPETALPLTPLTPALPAAPDAAPTPLAPAANWSRGHADVDADPITDPVAEAPAAASGPVVSVNVSSDVLLIGGAAALVLIAGAAVLGRSGD
ncbi:hypothetical protein EV379_2860 [Microterricola gilva]|uniref:Uncharacterized protein n=1 Tax=Microterricola gilva TaxID=393267 RepID=A0A4Q8AP95_9MICO|nr:hypothetical protein EV379_2860 [Microterricola gilva]